MEDGNSTGNQRKRYKTFLNPDYQKWMVSPQTDASWRHLTESKSLPKISDNDLELPSTSATGETSRWEDEFKDQMNSDHSNYSEPSSCDNEFHESEHGELPGGANCAGHRDFVDDRELNERVMFEAAKLTTTDVLLMIMGFSIRFSLSNEARNALVELLKTVAGPIFHDWNVSDYKLSRLYDPPDEVISYTFYCTSCYEILTPSTTKLKFRNKLQNCATCHQDHNLSLNSSNYFLSIDLEYQIKTLLDDEYIRKLLLDNIENIRTSYNLEKKIIRDVHDGVLYQNILEKANPQASYLVTYNFNTDGAPLFHSSKRSFWPLQIILNELPPKLRFKIILLAGLWTGNKEPSAKFMNTYLHEFVKQAKHLRSDGIMCTDSKNRVIKISFAPLCSAVDSVARPVIQNRIQFNGYMGCSWCYAHGKYAAGAMRYPMEEDDPNIRTHSDHLKDAENVAKLERNVNGVKGLSILMELFNFDMVWGFPVEYLHCVLLGVARLLWEMWTTPGSAFYLKPSARNEINDRLKIITPPHEIHRLPRTLSDKAKWKATEWRSWLLFYSLPCLNGILNDTALEHLSLLSGSIFTLLQECISEDELQKCEYDLMKFVGECEILYGEKCMTFNIHSLLHLVQSVRMSGPLWATSAFPFGSTIYNLKRQVNGPRGVNQQMSNKHLQSNNFRMKISKMTRSETCSLFCQNIFSYGERATITRSVSDNVVFFGQGNEVSNVSELLGLTSSNVICTSYNRCIYNNTVLHGTDYKRPKATNDTVVQLKSQDFVQITRFLKVADTCYIQAERYEVSHIAKKLVPHIVSVKKKKEVTVLPIKEIKQKCLLIALEDGVYISRLPNVIEIQ